MRPTMTDLLRVLAGKGRIERPADDEPAAFTGSADGGLHGVPLEKPGLSMNELLRAARGNRYER